MIFLPCPAAAGTAPSDFEQGKQLFVSGNYPETRKYFAVARQIIRSLYEKKNLKLYRLYLERIEVFLSAPPPRG